MAERSEERIAVYPGTFDPVTNGHLDIIARALGVFDGLVVAVLDNGRKEPLFSAQERVAMLREAVSDERVSFGVFSGLLVDYLRAKKMKFVVRGLRAMSDFDYEFQMAIANKKLMPEMETVFIMTDQQHFYLNSSLVRELSRIRAPLDGFVPAGVEKALREKFK